MNILLWITQILLAFLFLFAGGTKLIFSAETLQRDAPSNAMIWSGWFLKFIGVCELLGALGLVLPGLLRTQQYLTPLAAIGLLIIMIGAVVVTVISMGVGAAIPPLIIGLLCAFVAYGRRGSSR